jgi:hypothetical protein
VCKINKRWLQQTGELQSLLLLDGWFGDGIFNQNEYSKEAQL